MYSTTTLAKNSKLTGKLVGTHQQLDQAARKLLAKHLPRGRYFPNIKEIRHFSGALGPDGLKRKSPDDDDPSHMFDGENGTANHGSSLQFGASSQEPQRSPGGI